MTVAEFPRARVPLYAVNPSSKEKYGVRFRGSEGSWNARGARVWMADRAEGFLAPTVPYSIA